METVSKTEFARLASLSKLSFPEEEYESFKEEFEKMIGFTKTVSEEDREISGTEPEQRLNAPEDLYVRPDKDGCSGYNTGEDGFYRVKRLM